MRRLIIAAAALILSLWAVVPLPAAAQSTIDEVMVICTDVINRQYDDDRSRDGQCIGAVAAFLDVIGAPSAEADAQVAELVIQLVELYRDDPECKIAETELPEAIQIAAGKVLDEEIKAEYILIAEQVDSRDFSPTAAIDLVPAPASAN